jgi:signal transduction histidine kinase
MRPGGIKVLVVEDSATQAQKLKQSLETKGFLVATAPDGAAGMAAALECRPSLVICDIVMPGIDGYEVCRRIKADARLKDTPVVLLTTLSDPQDVIRGLECGADGFTIKTESDAPVLEAIERLLRPSEPDADSQERSGVLVQFAGQSHRISPRPQRIFDFLISTYNAAYSSNAELQKARDELATVNGRLEERVRDRTEELARKNEEISATYQQLWHSAKLATLGELTASVAHELNNPLQTVSVRIESLSGKFSGDPGVLKALSVIEGELERMARLVRSLLQLSRKGEQRIETVDAAEELEKTHELLRGHLKKYGIETKRDFPSDRPLIRVDPEQLRQAFLNLLTNACDAMPTGGILTLRVRGGAKVTIDIVDTGTGIAAEDLPRVMETFFTTKPPGKGTGLGLPICRRIVEAHGGEISIESEQGRGTTVRIALPAEGEEGQAHDPE